MTQETLTKLDEDFNELMTNLEDCMYAILSMLVNFAEQQEYFTEEDLEYIKPRLDSANKIMASTITHPHHRIAWISYTLNKPYYGSLQNIADMTLVGHYPEHMSDFMRRIARLPCKVST